MDVAYPLYFSVSGNDAFVLGTKALFPGAAVANSVTIPNPTEWWLRP